MTEQDYKRLRRGFAIMWFLLCLSILLNIFTFIAHGQPTPAIAGPKGDTGKQGIQGVQGPVGPQGTSGTTVITNTVPALQPLQPATTVTVQGPKGDTGATGAQGPQGAPAPAAREIELRSNPITGDLEWRYTGDDLWTVLLNKCSITNTCGEDNQNGTGQ